MINSTVSASIMIITTTSYLIQFHIRNTTSASRFDNRWSMLALSRLQNSQAQQPLFFFQSLLSTAQHKLHESFPLLFLFQPQYHTHHSSCLISPVYKPLYDKFRHDEWYRLEQHRIEYNVTPTTILKHLPPPPACPCGGYWCRTRSI